MTGCPKEAQAVGLPLVATASPGTVETVAPPYRHELVPENDSRAFAAAIVRLAEDRESWPERARAGREWVEDAFDWQRLADRISAIYAAAIEARRPLREPVRRSTTDRYSSRCRDQAKAFSR